MAFNKKAHLHQNIEAIKLAFFLEKVGRKATDRERETLALYRGFGGIKEILDDDYQKKAPTLAGADFIELKDAIRKYTKTDQEYKRYMDGIKASVLSAFYTPPHIIEALLKPLVKAGVSPQRVLDPSAGIGTFGTAFDLFTDGKIWDYEKDPMTGLILKHLHPGHTVRIDGFETMEGKYAQSFDIIASNIPFGEVAVFDPLYSTHRNPAYRQATRSLHNFFFVKASEMVREGGLVAFITSQGFLNAEKNKPIREALMQTCRPVSVVRLPNNLFSNYAGTDVGSDMVILQRDSTAAERQSQRQRDFIECRKLSNGISINNLFQSLDRVVHTEAKVDTDLYGKPAMVFTHAGGIPGIAADLERMLAQDFGQYLDVEYYQSQGQGERIQTLPEKQEQQTQIEDAEIIEEINSPAEKPHPEFPNERPAPKHLSPDWVATEQDWQDFNVWFAQRQSATEAEAEGYSLDEATGELTEKTPRQRDVTHTQMQDDEPTGEEREKLNGWIQSGREGTDAAIERNFLDARTGENIKLTFRRTDDIPVFKEYEPTQDDIAAFGEWAHEKERQIWDAKPPQPEDYPQTEIGATAFSEDPVREESPKIQTKPVENFVAGTLFDNPIPPSQETTEAEAVNAEPALSQEPLLSLYDLLGFSAEERSQVNRPRKRGRKPSKPVQPEQPPLDWREKALQERIAHDHNPHTEAVPSGNGNIPITPQPERRPQPSGSAKREMKEPSVVRAASPKPPTTVQDYTPVPFTGEILAYYKEGTIIIQERDNEAGTVSQIGYLRDLKTFKPMFFPLVIPEGQRQKVSLYTEIRDTYFHLYDNEARTRTENPALRQMLNRLYDDFIGRFGRLNDKKNLDFIKMDACGTEILSLERYIDGIAHKADIFDHPVAFKYEEITKTENAWEALAASLNKYARVDLDYMASLTGGTRADILEELKGRIYYDPFEDNYDVSERVISGNVIAKADRIDKYLRKHPDDKPARETLEALHQATPIAIAFDDLDFNFGERWVPSEIYSRFASHLFDTNVQVRYERNIDEFFLHTDRNTIHIGTEYAVRGESRTYNGLTLMKHALHNTTPDITKTVLVDGKKVRAPDNEAIQEATTKIERIRTLYVDWLRDQSPEFKDKLAGLYNRTFNCYARPKYDGSHLTFPGLDLKGLGIKELYQSQKDAVWMDILLGGMVCDHEVGSGKSLIMCMAAMENKRIGLINKPIIIGLKANIHEIAKTFCTAYPNARVLYPGKEDFTPKNRQRIFREIKNNDWDAVILTHEQFGKIPQSPEIQREILQAELSSVEENLEVLKQEGQNISPRMMQGCISRKLNLEAKLRTVMQEIEYRKDDAIDFGLMGIDKMYVDEYHKFKNLTFNTRHDRVAGLGNPAGSQRALNMLFAIRTIQQRTGRDLGAMLLSGTVISNSLTELYSLFKYMRPKELARQNIPCFDAWAAIFAKKTKDYELTVTNQIKIKERFRYFIKVPELAQFYAEITDYRTAEDVGIDRPKKNEILYNIPPTPDQQEFNKRLVKFAETGDGTLIHRGPLTDSEDNARMLIATNGARKGGLDMRLISPDLYTDNVDNKASHCAKNVSEYYNKYNEYKATQLVFCDLGTYKPGAEFNVYSEIKRKLVEDYGIPASQVRFIQEAMTEKKRKEMIADTNAGKIRVLFGSTETLGTGVNVQKRCVAVHILIPPWRPSDIDQCEGRAIRAGNMVAKRYANNTVDILLYATNFSLDAYIYGLLQYKQYFTTQIKLNNIRIRTLDEGSLDEKGGMNYAEYKAILTGNTDLLEKARLDKKVAALESERDSFVRGKSSARYQYKDICEEIDSLDKRIAARTKDLGKFNAAVKYNPDGSYQNPIRLNNLQTADLMMIGKQLNHIKETAKTGSEYETIGNLYGFDIVVKSEETKKEGTEIVQNRFYVRGEGGHFYSFNNGIIANDPRLASANFIQALSTIPQWIDKLQKRKEDAAKDRDSLEKIINQTWDKEYELLKFKSQVKALELKIDESLKEIDVPTPSQTNANSVVANQNMPDERLTVERQSQNTTNHSSRVMTCRIPNTGSHKL